jgi:hypothetical protein
MNIRGQDLGNVTKVTARAEKDLDPGIGGGIESALLSGPFGMF